MKMKMILMNENDFDDNFRTGAIWSEVVKIWDHWYQIQNKTKTKQYHLGQIE